MNILWPVFWGLFIIFQLPYKFNLVPINLGKSNFLIFALVFSPNPLHNTYECKFSVKKENIACNVTI